MSHGSGDFFKHQASCFDGGRVGIEGRESGGNQVGIDKVRALGFGGKEGAGEGGFAGTVRSGEDEDFCGMTGLGKLKNAGCPALRVRVCLQFSE